MDTKNMSRTLAEHQALQDFLVMLYTARQSKQLTQAQVAEIAGMTQAAYARIESGKGNPTLHTLLALAKALGVQLALQQNDSSSVTIEK